MTLLPWLLAISALLGLILLVRGWRGRRIDDHPLCRKCGYDLHGTAARPLNCPECGRELSSERAVRIGHRRRRRWSLAIGSTLLMASLAVGAIVGWGAMKGMNLNPYKPLWLLECEATASNVLNVQRPTPAQTEILARLNDGRLSQAQIDRIASRALDAQGDPNAAWHVWWGDFVEQAWLLERVTDDVVVRYIKQGVESGIALRVPPKTRPNAAIQMDIKHRPRRSGRGGAVAVELQPGAVVLEDGTQLRRAVTLPIHFPRFRLASTTHTGLESMFMVHLTPGRHTATTQVRLRAGPASQWRVEWFGAGAARGKEGDQIPGDAEMLAVWTFPLQATFEVVPDGQEIIERVNDPALANTIRDNIKIDRCTITQPQAGPTVLDCVLQVRDVPINLAFEVSFRVAGREWAVTDVSYESALGNSHMGPDFSRIRGTNRTIPMPRYDLTKPPVHDFPPEVQSVDIVLRTSTRLAENGALMRIWDGEIVIEDVPLHHVVPGGWKHRRSDGRLDGV